MVNNPKKISEDKLIELSKRIRPIVRLVADKGGILRNTSFDDDPEGELYFMEVNDLDGTFIFDPIHNPNVIVGKKAINQGINTSPYKEIETMHEMKVCPVASQYDSFVTTGLMFAPTVAQVLAQIPECNLERCVAFETIHNLARSRYERGRSNNGWLSVGRTRLYEKR